MEFWRKLKLRWDSNVTTILDDYTARSSQELSVSKGQHVRIIQKQPASAPEWCLIRLLNDQHQQQSNSSSTTGSIDLPLSKYTEGLVPVIILKSTKSPSASNQLPPPLSTSQTEPNGSLGNILNESKQRPSTSSQFSKRKSSFRRILKNPVRRLSLKDKTSNSDELITPDIPDDTFVNPRHTSSSNLNTTRKLKAFTFINTDDLTSLPDDTNSTSKSIDGLCKMTDSSIATTVLTPRNDFETDVTKIPSPSTTTSSSSLDIRSSNAPINIVSGFSASDFHIPTALSITTPSVDDTSIASMPTSSSSSSTITVMPNTNPIETTSTTDEISLNDSDQGTLSSLTTVTTDEPIDDRTKYGAKRRHNIIELIETEKEYVKDLALIVEGYMNVIENDKEIKKPTGFVGRERVVFGNVQRIYEFHRDTFLPKLEQCIENPDILGGLFTTNRFSPYVRYCENKPRSEYIVSEYHDYFEEIRKKLGQKLLVSDLLIKPVQRIMRYQLLLKEILKSTERMGDQSNAIRSALKVMIEVPQQANDMMNVGRIKDLPTNVHQLGELKLQDMLMVSEPMVSKDVEKKFKERRVFLFQQSMIFCDEIPAKDKYSSPNYIYKYELKINKLQHKEFKHNKDLFQFTLVEVDAGNTRRVTCQCKDGEQYELWVTSVNKVLQRQMDLIIALTNPTAALQKEQDSSMLLFTSSLTNRNQIKKSMSDRTSQSCELSKSSKTTCSSNSDISNDNSTKKSPLSFHLFDSILSRTTNKSISINITSKKPSSSSSTSSSYPQTSYQLPEQARCLYHYNAIKHDEICVHRGEYVQIINVDEDNRWYVRRQLSPTTKGWLPGFVLGIKYPNSTHNNSPNNLTTSNSSNNLNHF